MDAKEYVALSKVRDEARKRRDNIKQALQDSEWDIRHPGVVNAFNALSDFKHNSQVLFKTL